MAIALGDNIGITGPLPTDNRYFSTLTNKPWNSCSEVNTNLAGGVGGVRYTGLTVNIDGVEHWYMDGIEDIDLIPKTSGGGSGLLNWTGTTTNAIGTYISTSGICAQPNLTFDGSTLSVTGVVDATTCVSSPKLKTTNPAAKGGGDASAFVGTDGIITTGATTSFDWSGSQANGIGTYVDANTICSEPNLTFDGTFLNGSGSTKMIINKVKIGDWASNDDIQGIWFNESASDFTNFSMLFDTFTGINPKLQFKGENVTISSYNSNSRFDVQSGGTLITSANTIYNIESDMTLEVNGNQLTKGCVKGNILQTTTPAAKGGADVGAFVNAAGCITTGATTSGGGGIGWSGSTANGIGTYVDGDGICSEPNLTFNGTVLNVTGTAYASNCVYSPIVCATTAVRTNNVCLTQGAPRCICVATATDGGAGDSLTIIAGKGTDDISPQPSGTLCLLGAYGAEHTGAGQGAAGGNICICGGYGGYGQDGGNGGNVTICGGQGSDTDGGDGGNAGDVFIKGGYASFGRSGMGDAGDVKISGGYGYGNYGCVSICHGITERLTTTTVGVCTIGTHCASVCVKTPVVCATAVETDCLHTSRLGTFGTYVSSEVQGIWSIQPANKIDTNTDSFNNQLGMAYAYCTNGGAPFINQHQIVFTSGIGIKAAIGLTCGDACFNNKVVAGICFCSPVLCATTAVCSASFCGVGSGNKFIASTGCGTAVDWVATSDSRVKKCIEPISDALSKVDALCGRCYMLCEDDSLDMGLIAQEVQMVEPRLVSESEVPEVYEKYGIYDKLLGLKYDKFAGLLVEAIKELKQQNICLQNQINKLKE